MGLFVDVSTPSVWSGVTDSDDDWNTWDNSPDVFSIPTGNVGIGTMTPSAKLDIANSSGYLTARVKGQGDTNHYSGFKLGRFMDGKEWVIDYRNATEGYNDLTIGYDDLGNTGWHSWLTINDTDGNVGIGTTSPNSKLEVDGTVHSTSGGFKFPDDTIQTTAAACTGFGAWESRSENTVYQASSDGFVITMLKRPGGVNDGGGYILGYTDGNNPPTIMRSAVRLDRTYNSAIYNYDEYNSFSMPVKKGDYWRCTYTDIYQANSYVRTYFWMPVGE